MTVNRDDISEGSLGNKNTTKPGLSQLCGYSGTDLSLRSIKIPTRTEVRDGLFYIMRDSSDFKRSFTPR